MGFTKKDRDNYWAVVRRWAVQHHGLGVRDAQVKVYRLRRRLEKLDLHDGLDLLKYHAEPYVYADAVAGKDTNFDDRKTHQTYLLLRDGALPPEWGEEDEKEAGAAK